MTRVNCIASHRGFTQSITYFCYSKAQRLAIEAAEQILAEEESRLGITHAGFVMTSLPHKRVEDTF